MLDNIMKLAATNANRQFEVLEKIAINVANINTTGYKNKRFEQYLTNDNLLNGVTRVDVSQGAIRVTRRQLDVAVDGFGYIPVTQPDGTTAYTRDGSFTLNSQGYIITQRGDIVGSGIQIPVDYSDIQIKADGHVLVRTRKEPEFREVGKISLVRFANPEGLKNIGYNKLVAAPESGEAIPDNDSQLKQGCVEQANVNVHTQVDQVLRLNAGLISNMRIIKFADDLYRQSVNLRQ
jgi:flagellar basal-body rod protein FlgG